MAPPATSDRPPAQGERNLLRRLAHWFAPAEAGTRRRRLHWRRVAAALAGLGLAGYVGGAAAVWAFLRHQRGFDTVQLGHVALPWRWDEFREARGEHHLRQARQRHTEGRQQEALLLARAGLARAPAHREGRLLLVELLTAAQQPGPAREALLGGLPHHVGDEAYLRRIVTMLLQQQEDVRLVALARTHLPGLPPASAAARVLALGAATASYYRGNYDQAEDFLRRGPRLAESRDGRFLLARLERERGWPELGLVRLRELATEFPRDVELQRELVGQLRAHGRADEARRAALALQIAHPALAGPRLDLLEIHRAEGDHPRVQREVEAFLRDFAGDGAALLDLAEWAASAGDVALVRRVAAQAADARLPAGAFGFLVAEAAIAARDYAAALAAVRAAAPGDDGRGGGGRAVADSLQALAHQGLGDSAAARVFLNSFLERPDLRVGTLLTAADRFAALGAASQAEQVWRRALELDPQNQAALAKLLEYDLTTNRVDELARHVLRYVQVRRPSPDLLRRAQQRLAGGADRSAEAAAARAAIEEALGRSPVAQGR